MISYIFEHNIDSRVLDRASHLLESGKLICFPSDTSWLIAGDPFQKESIEKIYSLKSENKFKHFSLLTDGLSLASEIAIISDAHFRLMKKLTPGHFTFILPAQKKIMKALAASRTDKEVGIRIPPSPLIKTIIGHYGKCLISTNVTTHMLGLEKDAPIYPLIIQENLEHFIKLIIDPTETNFVGSSTIISLMQDTPFILRPGAGVATGIPMATFAANS